MTIHARAARGRFETQPNVPLAPLIDVLVRRRIIPLNWTIADLHQALGGSRFLARQAVSTRHINVWVADHVATQLLAVHPTQIWGDQWLDQEWLHHPNVDREVRADLAFQQLRQQVAS